MASLDCEAETEALLVDYRPMAEPEETTYNSRGETSHRSRVFAHRNGSTQSDDELLDVIMPSTSGFANKDVDPERLHSKSACCVTVYLVYPKYLNTLTSLILLFHTDHKSPESQRIDKC